MNPTTSPIARAIMMFGIIEETLGRERWFPALLTGTFVTRVSAKTRKHATLFMPDVPRNLCRILRVSSAEPSSQETNFEASIEGSPIPAPFGFSAAWAGSRIGRLPYPGATLRHAGNRNHSDSRLRTRIRSARMGLPPISPRGTKASPVLLKNAPTFSWDGSDRRLRLNR
jgi:hypothetical protein